MNKLQKVWENYKKPTPDRFRKKGDWALVIGLIALLAQLVDAALLLLENDKVQAWLGDTHYAAILSACTLFAIIYKFYTNTQPENKDEDTPG